DQPALVLQIAECLHAAAACSPPNDQAALQRLRQLEEQVEEARPGSELAASINYLEMQAEYDAALTAAGKHSTPAVRKRRDRLVRFVQKYPQAAKTPDALLELAAIYQANGQKEEARASYLLFAEQFPQHAQA